MWQVKPIVQENTVSDTSKIKTCSLIAVASLALSQAPLAVAQNAATSPTATAEGTSATPSKQERKAAKKQARAKKNAELKKLEDAGYSPGARDDSNYPQDIQEAQKKAGIGQPKQ
jgi:ribosome-binding protein aMBF1 (putative translation factor)